MARRLVAVAVLGVALTGCVSKEKYEALKLEKDQLVEQLGQSNSSAQAATAAAQAYKDQYERLLANSGAAGERALQLQRELDLLKTDRDDLKAKYERALQNRDVQLTVINPGLKAELDQLAAQFPDIVELDAARGILRFKSDVTFDKGKADLTAKAKAAIARAAQILNSPAAREYEFLVAGHTDNTPVRNTATVAAGHKDNWYLSAHRAIVVGGELRSHNVGARRLGVAGYADQRPIADNASAAGQARNRRVEIAILPTGSGGPAVDPVVPANRTANVQGLNKDATVTTDNKPLFNK